MSSRSLSCLVVGVAALAVFAGAASFSAVRAEEEKFAGDVPTLVLIDVGGAVNDISTNASFSGPNGLGATIDFEDVFDLPGNKTTARMLGTARISPKRRYIDFGYVSIDRSGSRILEDDVTFAGYTLQAGGRATARFATQFIYAAFRYDFLHEDKIRISGSAGMTFLRFKTALNADGAFVLDPNGDPITDEVFRREGSAGAPVPMIGLNLDWALTKRLVVRTYNRFFNINVEAFNGGLYEAGVRLNWYFARHFGLGLGYDRTELKLKELKVGNDNLVRAGYSVNGVGLYANLAF